MKRPKIQAARKKGEISNLDRIKIWALDHLHALVFSLGQLYRHFVTSLLTICVIGITLALPTGFYIVLENAQIISSQWDDTFQITAFLDMGIDDARAKNFEQTLSERTDIVSTRYIDKETALNEYRASSGFAAAIDALDENPLPALILIKPDMSRFGSDQETQHLIETLEAYPEVEQAIYDQQWVKRLSAGIQIIQRTIWVLSGFLALAILLIIGNTIRMGIYNRRSEIEITKLFGATDAFIHRPFLYSGFWYGFLGALVAWLITYISVSLLKSPINQLAGLYASTYQLKGLGLDEFLFLVFSGILLGLLGSWIAVHRHLVQIEP